MSKKDIWVSIGGHRCKFDDLSFDLQNRISVSYKDIYGESLLSEKKEVKNLDLELTKLENIVLKYNLFTRILSTRVRDFGQTFS